MQFTRTSPVSGITRTLDLDVTESQLKSWNQGTLIQDAFPQLSSEKREFILTGITDAEWEEFFPEEQLLTIP